MRIDAVLSDSQRFSVRSILDRDDSITFNRVAPGEGSHNNVFPGDFLSGSHSMVLSSSMVNEMSAGFSHNHYGFRVGTGELNMDDYTSYYRSNFPFDPPRLEPFGPYGDPKLSRINVDEYPYMPDILFLGGNRSNMARWRPWAGNTRPGPTWNENYRYTFQNDLSWTKGRHNMKFGFVTERDAKTEPGSATYAGVYDFGHSGDNPLSTGNGYANALLGYFTRYEERTNRVDRERRHWQTDFYAQDSWRMTPRMTLDYGLRVAHHGAIYEVRDMNSAFDPGLFDPKKSAGVLRAVLHDRCQRNAGVRGGKPASEESADRRSRGVRLPGHDGSWLGQHQQRHFQRRAPRREGRVVLRHALLLLWSATSGLRGI